MKKQTFTIIFFFLFTVLLNAQVPQAFKYQAVVRDASGQAIANQSITLGIDLFQNGNKVYSEDHSAKTNDLGLVNLEIGRGMLVAGSFSAIDWSIPTTIEVWMDRGNGFEKLGDAELLSVPYALHAKTAESITGTITETDPIFGASVASHITGTDTTNWNNKQDQLVAGTHISIVGNTISATGGSTDKFYLGQDTLGGIVYYIYKDAAGTQHGLIVSKHESAEYWQYTSTLSETNATSSWDGAHNTGLMTGSPAADYVNGLTDGGFTDWYLPSVDELSILWYNRFLVNKILHAGNYTLLSPAKVYWSSTEFSEGAGAFAIGFYEPSGIYYDKTNRYLVRAIRAF